MSNGIEYQGLVEVWSTIAEDSLLTIPWSESEVVFGSLLTFCALLLGWFLGWYYTSLHQRQDKEESALHDTEVGDLTPVQLKLQSLPEQLSQQVQTLDTILSASPDHFYMFDRDGRFIYASRAGLQALGLQQADIIGKTEQDLGFPPELIAQHQQRREAVFTTGEIHKGEISIPTVDGMRQHEYVLIPIPDSSGSVQVVVAISKDVTEQKQAEAQLRRYRQQLEKEVSARTDELVKINQQLQQIAAKLQNNEIHLTEAQKIAHIGSWEFDSATQTLIWSDEMFRILGLNPQQATPSYAQYIRQIHPDDRQIWQNHMLNAIAQGQSFQIDFRLFRPDGSMRYVSSRGLVHCKQEGQGVRLLGTLMDITERKQTEAAQRESEEQLRQIFVQAPIGMALIAPEGTFLQVNQAFCQMLGYTETELKALNYGEITHPEDLVYELPYIKQCCKGEISSYQIEKRYLKKPGDFLFTHLTCSVVRDQQGRLIYGLAMIQDNTERKQAEQELQRQTQYRQLLAEMALRIRASLQIEVILQTAVTELKQLLQADRVLFYRLLPNCNGTVVAEAVVNGWQSLLGRELVNHCLEGEYLKQYQQEIHAWPDVEQAGFHPCHLEMLQEFNIKANLIVPVFLKDKIWGMLFVHQCGATRQWNSLEIDLLRQLADQLSIALAQAHLLEQATNHSEELARSNRELEQFAYVASHDLQEPLRTLASYAKLLSRRYGNQLDEKGNRFIQYISEEAVRMQVLINDLLRYSRVGRQAQTFAPCDCAAVFDVVVRGLEGAIANSGATITRGELPIIMADETQMVQLLQNLISNAIKYRSTQPPVIHFGAESQDQQWLFWVRDNGIGLDLKYAERIFVIFQRLHTQEEYSGTGIGLAIAAKIVEGHGGRIWVESEVEKGSTFYFTIPKREIASFPLSSVGVKTS